MARNWFIRLAKPSDAQELTTLIHQAYRGEGGWTTEKDLVDGQRASLAEVEQWLHAQDEALGHQKIGETEQEAYSESTRRSYSEPIFVAVGDKAEFNSGDSLTTPCDTFDTSPSQQVLLGCIQPSRIDTPTDDLKAKPSATRGCKLDNERGGQESMLGLFAVNPGYQSCGVGKYLLNFALQYMRTTWHSTTCIITVIEVRQEIIPWYEKQGFTWDGITKKAFPNPHLTKANFEFRVMKKSL